MLDKIEVARRQLGTALALFINNEDAVSVHVLACGGGEVAEHLTRRADSEPFVTHILKTFPDKNAQDVRRLRNQYWNSFKHATSLDGQERKDEELLVRFDDRKNDHALFIGWHDLMLVAGKLPMEAQVFQLWYYALYPEKLNSEFDVTQLDSVFPDLPKHSREEQKSRLKKAIEWARNQKDAMLDGRTDMRSLILDNAFIQNSA